MLLCDRLQTAKFHWRESYRVSQGYVRCQPEFGLHSLLRNMDVRWLVPFVSEE